MTQNENAPSTVCAMEEAIEENQLRDDYTTSIESRLEEAADAGLLRDGGRCVNDKHFGWSEPPEGFSYIGDAVHVVLNNRFSESYSIRIAGRIWVSAHKAGEGGALFIEINFVDTDGRTRRVDMPRGDLAHPDNVIALLLKDGADVDPTQARHVARYLAACNPVTRLAKEIPADSHLDLSQAIMGFDGLMSADLPERKLILPWLPEGGLAMVYAPRGLGKTFFGISLAVAVGDDSETDFMKWKIGTHCAVLYIDGEMALSNYRERLRGFTKNHTTPSLHTLSHENYYREFEQDLSVTASEIQKGLLDYLDAHPEIRFVVVDNLSSLTRIREDKSDDWREVVLPFLISCRRRGVAVLLTRIPKLDSNRSHNIRCSGNGVAGVLRH
jgi:hypothetical protein